ncbi:DUF7344 domain-containing protein [Halovivax gelatinilyticus]|uniref:DUF7344 domain-containing protein n=1 Tax=Halovivax gelatinilyticus TaxID=2961597 RepID=UPI0020CA6EDA|nr:hypothetical protein [Halovivax gelatinilyticus]
MSESVSELDVETVCTLIGSPRRQRVLAILDDADRPLRTREVVETLAAESDEPYERVRTSLTHVDLPKLIRSGVVEYDRERDRIEPTRRVSTLCRTITTIESNLAVQTRA